MNFTFFFAALLVLLEVVVLCPGAVGTEDAATVLVVEVVEAVPHGVPAVPHEVPAVPHEVPAVPHEVPAVQHEEELEVPRDSGSETEGGDISITLTTFSTSLTLPTISMHSNCSAKPTLPRPLEKNFLFSASSFF